MTTIALDLVYALLCYYMFKQDPLSGIFIVLLTIMQNVIEIKRKK